jgi:hypothetical protein
MIKIILFSVLFLAGCASSVTYKDLLFSDSYDLQPKSKLTSQQMKSDTEVLIYALENAYGGRKYVDQQKLSTVIENLKALNLDGVDSKTFCVGLAGITASLPDNHLIIRMESSRCGGHSFPKGSVGKNIAIQKKVPWELNYRKAGRDKVPVLSVTSLPQYEDPVWRGFEDTLKKLKLSKTPVIIDIRGNSGGSDARGHQLASYFYGQDHQSSGITRVVSQTPATFAMRISNDLFQMHQYRKQSQAVPDFLQLHLNKEKEKLNGSLAGQIPPELTIPSEKGQPFNSKKAFMRPIYILIDRECASSCESIIEFFENHPKAITVGENSGGFIHFGNVAKFVLPQSQVMVQMASDFWKYDDGRYREITGYEPKIHVKPGEDALQKALALIKQHRS